MERPKINPKFKGLINGKEWKSGSYKLYDNGLAVICEDSSEFYVFKDSVSRFTGFVNSFGQEIYEGDLLESEGPKKKDIQLVLWDENSHQWKVCSSPLEGSHLCPYLENCLDNAIVGHIFTHQHLLNFSNDEVHPIKGRKLVKR